MAEEKKTGREWPGFFEELGNVGSEHGARALSSLLQIPVKVSTIRVKRVGVLEIAGTTEVAGEVFLGVYFTIYGERDRNVLVMISRHHACRVVDMLRKRPPGTTRVLDEPALSIVREVGNILTGSYLGAIRSLVHTPLVHSIPFLAMDQWGTIINSLLPSLAEGAEQVVLIQAEMVAESVGVCFYIIFVVGDWLP